MGIWIQIAPGTDQPIYAQIVAQIEAAVAKGDLRPGDRLPTVRQLAEELVLNPNTVAKAYRLMEMSGLVATRKGAGTFVSDPALRQTDARDLNLLGERLDTVIGRALSLGLTPEQLRELFERRLAQFGKGGKKT